MTDSPNGSIDQFLATATAMLNGITSPGQDAEVRPSLAVLIDQTMTPFRDAVALQVSKVRDLGFTESQAAHVVATGLGWVAAR